MTLTDAFALCGWALFVCACVAKLFWLERLPARWVKVAMMALLFFSLLVPVSELGLPLVAYLRGIGGDLSVTLLALSVLGLCHRLVGTQRVSPRDFTALMGIISVAALLLYPAALGWGDWDAYRPGWGSGWFLSALLLICIICFVRGLLLLPALVALALLGWAVGLLESSNLWDYLMDPWLSVYALGFVLIKCVRQLRGLR